MNDFSVIQLTPQILKRLSRDDVIAFTYSEPDARRFSGMIDIATTSYRYILCQDETVAYLSPSEINHTHFRVPDTNPDWIYIDRSANVGARGAGEILSFLNLSQNTKLAIFIGEHSNQYAGHMRDLIKRADLIFTDVEFDQKDERQVVRIGEDTIRYHDKVVTWNMQTKQDIMTRLTSHLTIAASILGAILLKKNSTEALLLARANVQGSNLSNSVNLDKLEASIADDYYLVQRHNPKGEKMWRVKPPSLASWA